MWTEGESHTALTDRPFIFPILVHPRYCANGFSTAHAIRARPNLVLSTYPSPRHIADALLLASSFRFTEAGRGGGASAARSAASVPLRHSRTAYSPHSLSRALSLSLCRANERRCRVPKPAGRSQRRSDCCRPIGRAGEVCPDGGRASERKTRQRCPTGLTLSLFLWPTLRLILPPMPRASRARTHSTH
jgi:hypothetical protein